MQTQLLSSTYAALLLLRRRWPVRCKLLLLLQRVLHLGRLGLHSIVSWVTGYLAMRSLGRCHRRCRCALSWCMAVQAGQRQCCDGSSSSSSHSPWMFYTCTANLLLVMMIHSAASQRWKRQRMHWAALHAMQAMCLNQQQDSWAGCWARWWVCSVHSVVMQDTRPCVTSQIVTPFQSPPTPSAAPAAFDCCCCCC